MTRSSPTRRSQLLSSPDRSFLSSFLSEDRNNEVSHLDALAAAHVEHERVRAAAIRVYELHELKEEHKRIVEQEKKEQERLKMEEEIVAEEKRLRELRAKSVPRPPPEPEPKPEPVKQEQPPPKEILVKQEEKPAQTVISATAPAPAAPMNGTAEQKPQQTQPGKKEASAPASNPFAAANGAAKMASPAAVAPISAPAAPQTSTAPPAAAQTQSSAMSSQALQVAERYSHIHQELKKLRQNLAAESKRPGSPLKGQLGTYRREVRTAIGQLTGVAGANTKTINKITATLTATLNGTVQSPAIDVSLYVLDKPQPQEGAVHNGDTMPALFIYLLNICAKGIINQFINEAGPNPKAADPVGVFTAHIFSNPDFLWRGKSLIDILMAKFRVSCPVLFGFCGNDRTEKGRLALGWRKEGAAWIMEQAHNDRMTGLGAGYASVSLRDFSKSKKQNPYPPTNYWRAMARIVNTPQKDVSNTSYVVLRAMIEGHEKRFLTFYGSAAVAALKLALIEYPKKAPDTATAAASISGLVEALKSDGLILA